MKPGLRYIFLLAVLFTLGIGACNKNADDSYISPRQTQLDVVNATDVIFNLYQNGTRLSNSANISVSGHSGYLTVNAGMQRFSIKKPLDGQATTVLAPSDTILSRTLAIDSGARYTWFIGGTENSANAFYIKETLPASPTGNALIRFVHAASKSGSITVSLNDTVLVTGTTFQSVSNFTTASSSQKTIKIYKGNSTVPAYTKVITLSGGSIYTLFARDSAAFVSSGLYVNQ